MPTNHDVNPSLQRAELGRDALPGFAAHDDGIDHRSHLGGATPGKNVRVVMGREGLRRPFGDAGKEGEVGFDWRPREGSMVADAERWGCGYN